MRLSPRLIASTRKFPPMTFAPFVFAIVVLGLGGGGCEDNHIGRPCSIGIVDTDAGVSSGSVATVTSPALECPSRICLIPGADKDPHGTGALCTAGCSSNDDCDGEKGNPNDPTDHRCKLGFVCMWPTTSGPFCCERMCACRDFVSEPMGGFTKPAACNAPSTCQNVH
jgi:hypothetical protein